MKVTVEFGKDGLLIVRHAGHQYVALEAAFRTDGAVPMMDLSIPLAEIEPDAPEAGSKAGPHTGSRTFDL